MPSLAGRSSAEIAFGFVVSDILSEMAAESQTEVVATVLQEQLV